MRVKNPAELGHEIRKKRKKLNITQAELSQRTGLSASFISEIENGKETAELGKVMLLVNILGLNMSVEER